MDTETYGKVVKYLTVSLYTELSDYDKLLLGTDLREILETPSETHLTRLSHLYTHLLSSYKPIKSSKIFPQFQENEIYQTALQKLDFQIREHIKQELQLKLMSEELTEKLSEPKDSQKLNETEKIEMLLDTKERLLELNRIKSVELENLRICDEGSDLLELRLLRENVGKEEEKVRKAQKKFGKAQSCWKGKKVELDELKQQFERDKVRFVNLKSQVSLNEEMSLGVEGKYFKVEGNENKSCRSFRKGAARKEVTPILAGGKAERFVKLSQSTKRIKHPIGVKGLRDSTSKLKGKVRLQMYSTKK